MLLPSSLVFLWGLLSGGVGGVSVSFACLWDPFPPTGLPHSALMRWYGQVLLWFVMPCLVNAPGKLALF